MAEAKKATVKKTPAKLATPKAEAVKKVEAPKTEAVKAEAPKAEAVKKAPAKTAVAKKAAAPKAEAAKKAPAKKAAAPKKAEAPKAEAVKKAPAKKAPAKKAVAPKKAAKTEAKFEIQYNELNVTTDAITEKFEAIIKEQGKKVSAVKDVKFYINVSEGMVYYVINDAEHGSFGLR